MVFSPQEHPVTRVVFTDKAPQPIGPYSQAVPPVILFSSPGQIGIDPATGNVTGSAGEQATRAMENLGAVLRESDLGFGDVVQTRIYLVNMSDWTAVNTVYGSYFQNSFPARSTIQVAGLPRGGLVEIEMVAMGRQSRQPARSYERWLCGRGSGRWGAGFTGGWDRYCQKLSGQFGMLPPYEVWPAPHCPAGFYR